MGSLQDSIHNKHSLQYMIEKIKKYNQINVISYLIITNIIIKYLL